ncbi:o-succinylbenzoate--CoA ligase [Nissabacter sp. SGAir0207]|uniref:o-succinylbenzoate--CoA ligase n=1 Tax=Nissabacter sp. SGAir0207 TaxID=2126321 RepID=UPI0010CCB370|nr:o-succinylbenzoate--CoA ligase [Nissabacter sp. SGAir0207]QCR35513.1 o-succinylbenzoate--CoA ligase [Nissabacter sp. SGAir0207]
MAGLTTWPWRHWAQHSPDRPALAGAGGSLNWAQLATRLERRAAGYRAQGVTEGCGVVLRGANSPALLLDYLALIRCGARVLPLNPQLPTALLAQLLPGLDMVWLCGEGAGVPLPRLGVEARPGRVPVDWQPSRLATLTLTSGSSGLPKAAAHSPAAHLASAAGVLALLPFSAEDSWLLSLPLCHVSGQGIIWRWLTAGATLHVPAAGGLLAEIGQATHASLVPTQLVRLLASPAGSGRLRDVLLGGAVIPPELAARAEQRGLRCWCGYGMTEMASTVCAKRADGGPGVGRPLAGVAIRLAGEEVLIRAPGMAAGYWRDGALHPLVDDEGWYHSRDRGRWQGGELHIPGRLDNLFFSGGEGIQPEEVERVLLAHPQVTQAFVLPVADEIYGERPVAVLATDGPLPAQVLDRWLAGRLARYQQPDRYYSLPADLAQGGIKVARAAVRQWLAQQA